jgi:hypothetical protein
MVTPFLILKDFDDIEMQFASYNALDDSISALDDSILTEKNSNTTGSSIEHELALIT